VALSKSDEFSYIKFQDVVTNSSAIAFHPVYTKPELLAVVLPRPFSVALTKNDEFSYTKVQDVVTNSTAFLQGFIL